MSMAQDEFRGVIEAHQSMVFSIALRLTGDHGGAEEIAQDVFLELFRNLEKLQSDDHVRFWLRRVSVHRATDWLRRRTRQPETRAEEWTEERHDRPIPAGEETGVQARLEELLTTLPEPMRVAIVMRYQEEMPPDEIAALLAQPVATVKSNLRRGLAMLRRKAEITLDWHCSVHIREMKTGESTDVCNRKRDDCLSGQAVITVEPKSLTFIHTIGQGRFTVPMSLQIIAPEMRVQMAVMQAEMQANMATMRPRMDAFAVEMKNFKGPNPEQMRHLQEDLKRLGETPQPTAPAAPPQP